MATPPTLTLKKISQAALPAALAKAERYRLLNEPEQAESICRDVLAIEPANQTALVTLLLALTDQFHAGSTTAVKGAETVLAALEGEYQKVYYAGIVRERWGLALLKAGDPGRQARAWLDDAMRHYEAAEARAVGAGVGNDDAILRWNSCARIIVREGLQAHAESDAIDAGDAAPRR
jgi:hypothetical protein